jgi:hypothetical protein
MSAIHPRPREKHSALLFPAPLLRKALGTRDKGSLHEGQVRDRDDEVGKPARCGGDGRPDRPNLECEVLALTPDYVGKRETKGDNYQTDCSQNAAHCHFRIGVGCIESLVGVNRHVCEGSGDGLVSATARTTRRHATWTTYSGKQLRPRSDQR